MKYMASCSSLILPLPLVLVSKLGVFHLVGSVSTQSHPPGCSSALKVSPQASLWKFLITSAIIIIIIINYISSPWRHENLTQISKEDEQRALPIGRCRDFCKR